MHDKVNLELTRCHRSAKSKIKCIKTAKTMKRGNIMTVVLLASSFCFDPRMGVDPWVDRGSFPLLFEVEGMPCVLSPYFFRGRHFCTNAHGIH